MESKKIITHEECRAVRAELSEQPRAARSDESYPDRSHFTLTNQLCVSTTGQAGAAGCYLVYLLLAYGHGTPAFAHPRPCHVAPSDTGHRARSDNNGHLCSLKPTLSSLLADSRNHGRGRARPLQA